MILATISLKNVSLGIVLPHLVKDIFNMESN